MTIDIPPQTSHRNKRFITWYISPKTQYMFYHGYRNEVWVSCMDRNAWIRHPLPSFVSIRCGVTFLSVIHSYPPQFLSLLPPCLTSKMLSTVKAWCLNHVTALLNYTLFIKSSAFLPLKKMTKWLHNCSWTDFHSSTI